MMEREWFEQPLLPSAYVVADVPCLSAQHRVDILESLLDVLQYDDDAMVAELYVTFVMVDASNATPLEARVAGNLSAGWRHGLVRGGETQDFTGLKQRIESLILGCVSEADPSRLLRCIGMTTEMLLKQSPGAGIAACMPLFPGLTEPDMCRELICFMNKATLGQDDSRGMARLFEACTQSVLEAYRRGARRDDKVATVLEWFAMVPASTMGIERSMASLLWELFRGGQGSIVKPAIVALFRKGTLSREKANRDCPLAQCEVWLYDAVQQRRGDVVRGEWCAALLRLLCLFDYYRGQPAHPFHHNTTQRVKKVATALVVRMQKNASLRAAVATALAEIRDFVEDGRHLDMMPKVAAATTTTHTEPPCR